MITSNLKLNSLIELILVSSFLGIFISVMINLHPYPYYLIGSIEGNAAYDGEPDYFANIISTLINGHSMDFLHPGIPINYMSALSLGFFSDNLTPERIIIISRATVLLANCIFIYIGSRIVLKQDLISSLALLIVLLIYPAGFFLLDNLSPNSILFGLSVLIISLGSLIKRAVSNHAILFAFFLGFALAVKYIAIILIIPTFISLLFNHQDLENKPRSLFKIVSLLVLITILSFTLFAWPIAPYIPFIFTHHGLRLPGFLAVVQDPIFALLIFFACIALFACLFQACKSFAKLKIDNLYQKTCTFFLIILALVFLIYMATANSFLSLGYSLRNYLPILGMSVLFIPKILSMVFSSHFKLVLSTTLLLFLMMGLKVTFNFQSSQIASYEEQQFSTFLEQYDNYDFLVFYPPSSFTSKDIFIAWSDYRYGDSKKVFSEQNIPFQLTPRQKKVRILNSRKFNLISPDSKTSYQYFDYASKRKYLSASQKNVALNQMHLLSPKNICYQLFDGFESSKTSLIFFPASLLSFFHGNEASQTDKALLYVNNLKVDLKSLCGIESDVSKILYKQQNFYLLSIN